MDPIPGYDAWKLATPPEYSELDDDPGAEEDEQYEQEQYEQERAETDE